MWRNLEQIATAEDWNEAIDRWGQVSRDEQGIEIGPDESPFRLGWETIRKHR